MQLKKKVTMGRKCIYIHLIHLYCTPPSSLYGPLMGSRFSGVFAIQQLAAIFTLMNVICGWNRNKFYCTVTSLSQCGMSRRWSDTYIQTMWICTLKYNTKQICSSTVFELNIHALIFGTKKYKILYFAYLFMLACIRGPLKLSVLMPH